MAERKIRILIAKPGLDGHDRGAKVVALALRNAGFEVIYTGLHQSIDQIIETALQEDVDMIGLSILSGAHIPITEQLLDQMREKGIADKLVIMGGNIPAVDILALKTLGVSEVFPTGSHFDDIANYIRQKLIPA